MLLLHSANRLAAAQSSLILSPMLGDGRRARGRWCACLKWLARGGTSVQDQVQADISSAYRPWKLTGRPGNGRWTCWNYCAPAMLPRCHAVCFPEVDMSFVQAPQADGTHSQPIRVARTSKDSVDCIYRSHTLRTRALANACVPVCRLVVPRRSWDARCSTAVCSASIGAVTRGRVD